MKHIKKFLESDSVEFLEDCPSYQELKDKLEELKVIIERISEELDTDDNEEYINEFISDELKFFQK